MSKLQQSLSSVSVAENLATYERWASSYDSDVLDEGYIAPELAGKDLARCYGSKSLAAIKILDAGCGSGLVGKSLASLGATHVDGIDLSPAMLDLARQTGVYKSLSPADMTKKLDIGSGTYDAIICVGTLTEGHVGSEAIDELLRVVVRGGFLVLTVRHSVWERNGYKAKVEGLVKESKLRLLDDDFVIRKAAKGVDLVFLVAQAL